VREGRSPARKSLWVQAYLLLSADLAFIVLHLVWNFSSLLEDKRFAVWTDLGFSEVYQYVKEFWAVMLMLWLAARHRAVVHLNWALLFLYFLLDDSLQIHERMGRIAAARFALPPMFGLRSQDMGELVVSGVVGFVFLVTFVASYRFSRRTDRAVFHRMLCLVLILLFFGVVVDMGYWVVHPNSMVMLDLLGLFEDGGEMPAMSLIVLYAMFLVLEEPPGISRDGA